VNTAGLHCSTYMRAELLAVKR